MPPGASSPPSALLVSKDALVRAGLRGVLARGHWAVDGEVDTLSAARSAWLATSSPPAPQEPCFGPRSRKLCALRCGPSPTGSMSRS